MSDARHEDSVGGRIRALRRERGLTQDDLAAAVGVSRSAVAQWETDRAGQIRGNLARIASVLGASVEFLIMGTDKREPGAAERGDELVLLRLYRECSDEDRAFLLRTAHRFARAAHDQAASTTAGAGLDAISLR